MDHPLQLSSAMTTRAKPTETSSTTAQTQIAEQPQQLNTRLRLMRASSKSQLTLGSSSGIEGMSSEFLTSLTSLTAHMPSSSKPRPYTGMEGGWEARRPQFRKGVAVMDAMAHERLMALIECEDHEFKESVVRMLGCIPLLATAELHDPRSPVYHPMTSSSGFPPLAVMFNPADGFHVLVFKETDSTPRPTKIPLSECYRNPNDAMRAERTAHTTSAQHEPAYGQPAEMIPSSDCRCLAKW